MPKTLHIPYYALHVVLGMWLVDYGSKRIRWRIQFKYRIVYQMESLCNLLPAYPCCIGKHRNNRSREIPVPQFHGVAHNLRELRIQGRLPVSRKGYRVDGSTVGGALTQFRF